MTIKRIHILVLAITVGFASCNEKYLSSKKRNKAVEILSNKDIDITQDRKTLFFSYPYKNCKCNLEYSIEDRALLGKTILDCDESIISKSTIDSMKSNASKSIDFLLENGINSATSKFKKEGIALKIYMQDMSVYLYCPDKNLLVKENFKTYIDSAIKLDSDWYFRQNDY